MSSSLSSSSSSSSSSSISSSLSWPSSWPTNWPLRWQEVADQFWYLHPSQLGYKLKAGWYDSGQEKHLSALEDKLLRYHSKKKKELVIKISKRVDITIWRYPQKVKCTPNRKKNKWQCILYQIIKLQVTMNLNLVQVFQPQPAPEIKLYQKKICI